MTGRLTSLPLEKASVLLAPVDRWTAHRKARLLEAIRLEIVSEAAVQQAHHLSPEELAAWREDLAQDGIVSLRLLPKLRRQSHRPRDGPA